MPLTVCPHMNARCPHHRNECQDQESRDCLYIKTLTTTARARLTQLAIARMGGLTRGDERMDEEIKALEIFLRPKDPPFR